MKKLVLALLASTFALTAFAEGNETPVQQPPMVTSTAPASAPMHHTQTQHKKPTHPAFNRHDIVCGEKVLGQKENVDSLSDQCKDYKYKKDHATFIDGHSGEHIMCKIKDGQLVTSTCNPIKKK